MGQAAHDRGIGGRGVGEVSVRTTPPFRADHVGSLLRSSPLKSARSQRERGEITAGQLKAVEDREISELIKVCQVLLGNGPHLDLFCVPLVLVLGWSDRCPFGMRNVQGLISIELEVELASKHVDWSPIAKSSS